MTESEVLALIKSTLLSVQIKLATKAAALWPDSKVLLAGQLGHEEDTGLTKIGNGYTQWSLLGYLKVNGADIIQSSFYRLVTDAEKVTWNGILDSAKAYADGLATALQPTSAKDASGGYVGKTLQKINFRNAADSFTSFLVNANTAARTYTYPDRDITVAGLDDFKSYASSTSRAISTGSKAFTVQGGLDLTVGKFYRVYSASAPGNWMEGICTAYTGTSFTLNVNFPFGSGTYTDWKIEAAKGVTVRSPTASYTSTTAVYSAVPGLSVTLTAGELYEMDLYGLFSSNTLSNGAGMNLSYSGTPDVLAGEYSASVSASTTSASNELTKTMRHNYSGISIASVSPVDTNHHIGFKAVIKFPVDTQVTIQWASKVEGDTSTLDIQSSWIIKRIG